MFSLNFDYLLFSLFPVRDVGSDFGVSGLCNFVSGLIYFSLAVSPIQITQSFWVRAPIQFVHIYSLYKKKRKHYTILNNLRTFEDEHFKLTGYLDWHVPYQLDEFHIFPALQHHVFVRHARVPMKPKVTKQYVMSITCTLKSTDSLCP